LTPPRDGVPLQHGSQGLPIRIEMSTQVLLRTAFGFLERIFVAAQSLVDSDSYRLELSFLVRRMRVIRFQKMVTNDRYRVVDVASELIKQCVAASRFLPQTGARGGDIAERPAGVDRNEGHETQETRKSNPKRARTGGQQLCRAGAVTAVRTHSSYFNDAH